MALTPRRRWCCRFCVLSERTGAVRIGSGEIDRCRCRRRRAQSRSPEPAVLPRFPARNYCHRPSYNGPLPPPLATDQPPVIKTSSVLVFSNSQLYAQCPSIVPPLCLTSVFKMFLIFKNHPNVCLQPSQSLPQRSIFKSRAKSIRFYSMPDVRLSISIHDNIILNY
jgi:hypothetical protein